MADLPPSYEEVVKNPPIPKAQSSAIPSAPPLESIATLPNDTEEQPSQPTLPNPYAQDRRFRGWDDRATKILVVNRLHMNERFEKAKTELERHLLWNVIVNHLLTAGYSFARIELMQYWKYLFSIYNDIIDDLYAGKSIDATWKYFKPMDNVFKYTTKRPKPTKNADPAAIREILPSQPMFSIVYNGIESQTEPMTTPHDSAGEVVTTQPRSTVHGYTPLTPSNNSNDDGGRCWCCWFCSGWWKDCRDACREGCCADNPSAYIARDSNTRTTTTGPWRTDGSAGRVGGYKNRSFNDVYNSTVYSIDELTSGLGKNTHTSNNDNDYDSYRDTSSYSNNHRSIINSADECFGASSSGLGTSHRYDDDDRGGTSYSHHYDTGGSVTTFTCPDIDSGDSNHHSSGGTSHNNHHIGYNSHDTGASGTSHSNHHTSYSCHDTGGSGTSHSNHHTGYSSHDTGASGTSHSNHHTSYSCHDTGGSSASHSNHDTSTSYSCHDTGGGSTSHSNHDTSTSYSCNDTGGGSTDYGCSDTGTTDYSCDTGGGYD